MFTIIGYYPCPSGHFPIGFYPFPHLYFVIEGEKKTTPRLAQQQCSGNRRDASARRFRIPAELENSWTFMSPLQGSGTLVEGGRKNVRVGRGVVECCDCHGRQATVQCCALLQKVILAGLGGLFPSSQQGGGGPWECHLSIGHSLPPVLAILS